MSMFWPTLANKEKSRANTNYQQGRHICPHDHLEKVDISFVDRDVHLDSFHLREVVETSSHLHGFASAIFGKHVVLLEYQFSAISVIFQRIRKFFVENLENDVALHRERRLSLVRVKLLG